jgi:outer membrane receptor protein involved in Fe transport
MGYDGDWRATDQIPARVAGVTIDRFGLIDPFLGGESSRYSLSGEIHHAKDRSWTRFGGYLMAYDLDLLSNFTYCLGGDETSCAIDDDEFLQRDDRLVLGARFEQGHTQAWHRGKAAWRYGAELQLHDIENGLFRTRAGEIRAGAEGTIRRDEVRQVLAGAFGDVEVRWSDDVRTIAGLRVDHCDADVDSDLAANSGRRDDSILSPKLTAVFGPWHRTEIYLNWGRGFHSNDARGVVTTRDPVLLVPVDSADPLVRAEGADLGVRTTSAGGLHASASLFWIDLDSELVFVGDAGTTEPGPASRRLGLELATFYRPRPWIAVDLDATLTDAEFTNVSAGEDRIPGAIEQTVAMGITVGGDNGPFGTLRWRYFGSFPLVEDDSIRGGSTSLVNTRLGWGFDSGLRVSLDGFNLLDREDADIQYYYASRLPGSLSPSGADEPAEVGVADVHFHAMESRTFRLWIEYAF